MRALVVAAEDQQPTRAVARTRFSESDFLFAFHVLVIHEIKARRFTLGLSIAVMVRRTTLNWPQSSPLMVLRLVGVSEYSKI
jgi:hypothetical protein